MTAQAALAVMRDSQLGGRFGPTRAAGFRLPCSLVGGYRVGVTNGGLPSRVMSELASITLGGDEFTCGLSCYHARCLRFLFVCFCFRAGHSPHHYQSLRVDGWHSVA